MITGPPRSPDERIVYDDGPLDGSFDEIYLKDVEVHFERTDEHNWYATIWRNDAILLIYMRDAWIADAGGFDSITRDGAA